MRPVIWAALLACAGCGGVKGSNPGPNPGGAMLNMSANVQHTLAVLNGYRAQHGAAALALDDNLTAFADTAAHQLSTGESPHVYFMAQASAGAIWRVGFCDSAGENQTGPGWTVKNGDVASVIDAVLKQMIDEGPGGGHYENIVNRDFTRVGVGIVVDGDQRFYFSNDFSGSCG